MKKILLLTAMIATISSADMKECEFRIEMGDITNKTALRLYDECHFTKALHKFKMARANYVMGFKHCLNTDREEELISKSEATSRMMNDKGLNAKSNFQKLIKG